jgi:hypothetical protein
MWPLLAAVIVTYTLGPVETGLAIWAYPYETTLTISGVVTFEDHFGPPNYGEDPGTDRPETAYILKLAEPIDVIPDSTSDDELSTEQFLGVRRIQMTGSAQVMRAIAARHWKSVTVSGKLFERHTGHHVTDVLIFVDSIRDQ